MRVKKYLALTLAAVLVTTMLTGCPWNREEDKTDDASSVPVTSTDTSQDDDDHDSGDDDSQPTKPSFKVSATNGNITDQSFVLDEGTGTYKATFTTKPKEAKYVVSSVEATVTTANETLSASWPDDTATRARTLSVRADTELKLTPDNDTNPTKFTLTGIPSNATSCDITVEFKDPGYTKTDDGTYMVYNADGLLAWADVVLAGAWDTDCTLTADITLTDNWTPIGSYSNRYTGTFDGAGHTISGLKVSSTGSYVGLFGYVDGGTVKNLNLANVSVSGNDYVGGVVGINSQGTVTGCYHATGEITSLRGGRIGGIVGENYIGTVAACYWDSNLSSGTGSNNGKDDTHKVDGTDVTWQTAVAAMNTALSGKGWQYELKDGNSLPTLKKEQ